MRFIPPAFWTRVLGLLVPRNDRDHVIQEMQALYELEATRFGRSAAKRRYRREVIAYLTSAFSRSRIPSYGAPSCSMFVSRIGSDLWRDVWRAGRSLRRAPGFTVVAVMTLTLGIGANTLIFTVVDHVALRPLPFDRPNELVKIWPTFWFTRGELDLLRRQSETLGDISGYIRMDGFNLTTPSGSRRITGHAVTPSLLDAFGVVPALGRNFQSNEERAGEDGVVLLSHGLWQSEYGANDGIVGQTIVLDGRSRTVVGVLPSHFGFPDGRQDVLVPIVMVGAGLGGFWGSGGYEAVARLNPSVTEEQAAAEARAISNQMRMANPLWTPPVGYRDTATIVSLRTAMIGDIRSTLLVLIGAVSLVLLVACANVANLLLARGLSRGRETAVRSALGASRWSLVREGLVESLVIAATGVFVALVFAKLALSGLVALLPTDMPRGETIVLDLRVVLATTVFALLAGLTAGIVPALRNSNVYPAAALREGGRSQTGGKHQYRLRAVMILVQIAIAVVLVTNAGLLGRSYDALRKVDTGLDVDGVMTARITPAGGFENASQRYVFYQNVVRRASVFPGVQSAAIGARVPFGSGNSGIATFIEGVTADPNNLPVLRQNRIMPGFLETLGVPLLDGRMFTGADGPDGVRVAIVDQSAADRFWPAESPIGRRIRYPWQGAEWIEVVGVVGSVADGDLSIESTPSFYVPLSQNTSEDATLILRADATDGITASAIRGIVRESDARVPTGAIAPLEDLIGVSFSRTRLTAMLFAVFAMVALTLGCIGVYGVAAYSVRSQTQEIGVRLALGANVARVQATVIRDGLILTAPGVIIGMLLAIPSARLMDSLLFGVSPFDPVTFAMVPLLLLVAGIVAVYVPARRATSVDPVEALRIQS